MLVRGIAMRKAPVQRQHIERISAPADKGLSKKAVEERVKKGYVNTPTDPNEKSTLKIIATNLFTFFNIVLFIIAFIFIGFNIYLQAIGRADVADEYFGFSKFIFLLPAVMNVCMGTFQEIKSLKVIKRLRIVTTTKSRVIRDGEMLSVDATEVVLDDILAVSAGEQATADLIVLSGEAEVDESMLTGESDYIKKRAGDTILSGSSIIVGSARCRADKIGDDTYAAELTRKVKNSSRHKSELMSSIMTIIKVLTVGLCIAAAVVTVTLVYKVAVHGSDPTLWNGLTLSLNDPVTWALIILTDGMFGVGIIPTGLVLTASVAMLVSIAQLTKKNTLVQELYSLENLSRVNIICLDKTGTLTDGTMTVSEVKPFIPLDEVKRHARVLVSTSDEKNATSDAVFRYFGSEKDPDIAEEIPFSSAAKYSGVVYKNGQKLLMGAPEYLVPSDDERLSYVEERAKHGNRVIAMTLDGRLIAFISIEDHIRDTARDTLAFFRDNGVEVKVISGDNPLTVSLIAQKCGIENAGRYISLADVPLEKIPEIADKYTIFARVSPEQKEALVQALQAKGNKVAMTGDGVNDILALRRSDFSITFAKATEAAKSCSDVVLLDNDFSHLKEVVGEGRRVIGNIQKTTVLYLMKSIAIFLFAFVLIPFAKGHMWFSIENMYMLEAAVIGTGGFLLSLEPIRKPILGTFLKNIVTQSVSAGVLTASAILLPIMLNTVPKFYGYEPFVSDDNVRAMMTLLTTIAGLVVVFSMCIPFSKYRLIALSAIMLVVISLGLIFPSGYIGGMPMGNALFAYDSAAGQTIFDSQFFHELFRPMNSPVVHSVLSDVNDYVVMRMFLYCAIPSFILIRFALENFAIREYRDLKKNRLFRIGRRLMLASGFVLTLQAFLYIVEFISVDLLVQWDRLSLELILFTSFSAFDSAIHIAIGIIGYKVWKDPTKTNTRVGFYAGLFLLCLSILPTVFSGGLFSFEDPRILIDTFVIFVITLGYVVGSIIVRVNFKQAIKDRRKKA